ADAKGKEPEEADAKMLAEVREMLQAWSRAWSQRNPEAYWSFYAGDRFVPSHGQPLAVWRQKTRDTLRALTFLQVEVDNLDVQRELPAPLAALLNKGPTTFIQVAFRESYRSNHLQNFSRKLMILGREADGWKIYREAASLVPRPGTALPPGFGIQVAAADATADPKKLLDEWSARGFQPQAVLVTDDKKQQHYSVRLAHFRERDRALFFRWLLLLATGVDGIIVPAEAAQLTGLPEAAPPAVLKKETDGKAREGKAADKPTSKKEHANAPDKKANKDGSDDAEVER
ncbi:MAG: hypothetical protein H7838_04720, partial [Magnetococcus sp. DMHC-8]